MLSGPSVFIYKGLLLEHVEFVPGLNVENNNGV